jgi:hypothetical protein
MRGVRGVIRRSMKRMTDRSIIAAHRSAMLRAPPEVGLAEALARVKMLTSG